MAHTPTTPSIAIKTTTRQAGRKESKEGNMRVECVCDWEARVKSWSSSSSDVFRRPPGDCFVVLLRFFVVVCVCVSDSRRFVVHRPSEHVMYTRFPLCESRSLYIKHASQSAVYGRTCCVVSLWLGEIHRNSWSIFIVVVVDVVVFFFATRSRRPESWQCVDDDDEEVGETHRSGIGHLIKVSNISKLVGTIRS